MPFVLPPAGYYFIDPNGGSSQDAIRVFCKMATLETCVNASNPSVDKGRHATSRRTGVQWLSDITNEEFEYDISYSQLVFLQMASEQATQTLTYHCKNSAIYFDEGTQSYQYAARLAGFDETQLQWNTTQNMYNVLEDSCSVSILL